MHPLHPTFSPATPLMPNCEERLAQFETNSNDSGEEVVNEVNKHYDDPAYLAKVRTVSSDALHLKVSAESELGVRRTIGLAAILLTFCEAISR